MSIEYETCPHCNSEKSFTIVSASPYNGDWHLSCDSCMYLSKSFATKTLAKNHWEKLIVNQHPEKYPNTRKQMDTGNSF